MADEVVRESPPKRLVRFGREVVNEVKRVTWPDRTQVRQLSIGVVLFALFIGGVISIIDVTLQMILVRAIPTLLGRP